MLNIQTICDLDCIPYLIWTDGIGYKQTGDLRYGTLLPIPAATSDVFAFADYLAARNAVYFLHCGYHVATAALKARALIYSYMTRDEARCNIQRFSGVLSWLHLS